MSHFSVANGHLLLEQVNLLKLAHKYGTPSYVYSRAEITKNWQQLHNAFGLYPHQLCYAVKANSNIAILQLLAKMGSGFDVVSEGELRRVQKAGGDPKKVVFSGVAKSTQEIAYAITHDIGCINIESFAELKRIQIIAQSMGKTVRVAIRVNPEVDVKTHPYIATGLEKSKFGISMKMAYQVILAAHNMKNVQLQGITCHIGSQITQLSPFKRAFSSLLKMVKQLSRKGIPIRHLDFGGGFGIEYKDERLPSIKSYVRLILTLMAYYDLNIPILLEPGRYIIGNAGVLLMRIEYLKQNNVKRFAIVDAGMNDLLRPALYQAYHDIENTVKKPANIKKALYDVVGPVCESSCVLGSDRELALQAGDVLAVRSVGAYASTMASNYNTRLRPVELLVDDGEVHVIRERDTYEQIMSNERLLTFS